MGSTHSLTSAANKKLRSKLVLLKLLENSENYAVIDFPIRALNLKNGHYDTRFKYTTSMHNTCCLPVARKVFQACNPAEIILQDLQLIKVWPFFKGAPACSKSLTD
jgi:hypothetical protein